MNFSTPEKMGIRSENILNYIKKLEDARLAMHDIIIMRHDEIVCEAYWKPFHKDFLHRMYSVTKSFVALAIGFLEQDGIINLDDPISKYFAEELKAQPDKNMHNQTIRHMLMMSTAKLERNWFEARCEDRVKFYFENDIKESRPSGTIYQYDSAGSFVLGVLVERLTRKTLIEFLQERLFCKIGVSDTPYMLKCPGGHSWSDSSLICTPRDLLLVAKFVMNKGKWNGEQILNEKFLTEATSHLMDNSSVNDYQFESQGYGYLIWQTYDNSFCFDGMGNQLAVCVPDKDIVFICNADNQGKTYSYQFIVENLFDMVIRPAEEKELPENDVAYKELEEYISNLTLSVAIGKDTSPFADKINGKTYILNENPMGIEKIKFELDRNKGIFYYTNAQGDKELPFGIGENAFSKFPQDGYSDEVGSQKGNKRYDCATSAAWTDDKTLLLKVQIIDKYFGNLHMHFGFKNNEVGIYMTKSAEDFLNEYQGYAGGKF